MGEINKVCKVDINNLPRKVPKNRNAVKYVCIYAVSFCIGFIVGVLLHYV